MKKTILNIPYRGVVNLPASKSDSQRILLAAALAKGTSVIHNVGVCDDEVAMLNVIQKIGAEINETANGLEITGTPKIPYNIVVNSGESGLATRLLSGIFAFSEGSQTINGEGSVLRRKFSFYSKNKDVFNCQVITDDDYRLPITFQDKAITNNFTVNGGNSSQDISGLLYGLALTEQAFRFSVIHLKSKPYLQMTLKTLSKFGIPIEHEDLINFDIHAHHGFQPCEYSIEGDWSSASYWLVAAALGKEIGIAGVQTNSLQADKQLLTILTNANCSVIKGPTIFVDGTSRTPIDVDLTHCPDLFPALTAYAALTPGISKIEGVHRLVNKESNRANALIEEFKKLNVRITIDKDQFIIEGRKKIEGNVSLFAHYDHRIAMSLAIVGMFTEKPILITGADSVEKSYPLFWNHLESLTIDNQRNND